jgi:predicted nucleic acid-binding protein
MTVGEICKGIDLLPASQKRSDLQDWPDRDVRSWFAGRILPVTESIAERWGRPRTRLDAGHTEREGFRQPLSGSSEPLGFGMSS